LLLYDEDAEVRRRVAEVLGEEGDSKSLSELERVVQQDEGVTLFGSVADAAKEAIRKIKQRHVEKL